LTPPPDCRYTSHKKTDRLYLHIFSWPFKLVHLPGLEGKVQYAKFLHDSSEVKFRDATSNINVLAGRRTPEGHVTLELPALKPDVEIPVVEIFLK
jgi:alpha-L-fucosidase